MGKCEEGLGFEAEQQQQQQQEQLGSPSSSCASAPDLDPTSAAEKTLDEKLEKLGLDEKESTVNEMRDQEDVVKENDDEDGNLEGESVAKEEETRRFQYPLRPGEPDCPFYLRTQTCRYGSNCKFNHPPRMNSQGRSSSESAEPVQGFKEKENGEYPERAGQPECKYYLKTGGCKFGKACRYNHPQEKSLTVPATELNFLGLPIRLGEKECPFYMRMGSCKFGTNCRFHHPDPTAAGLSDPISGYGNVASVPIHPRGVSQPTVPSWSLQRPSNDAIPYLDAPPSYVPMMLPPHQGTHLNLEWNGYQTPVSPLYPPEGKVHRPVASVLKDSSRNGDGSGHHYQQLPVDEFPERPGQKECQYFMKNGDCKYRSACKFHHPKNRAQKAPVLSPIGLPLRPDQIVCAHYSRYGICKYGPACKYDHPPNSGSSDHSVGSSSGHPPSIDKSAALGGPQMADTNMTLIQQPNSGSSGCPVVSC